MSDGLPLHPGNMHALDVELGDAKQLTPRVLNGGDGYNSKHAAWGYARLLERNAADPFVKTSTK